MYKKDYLKDYIYDSVKKDFCDDIKVRLSRDLASKYENGNYNRYLMTMRHYYEEIKKLNIKFPGNANPTLYIYIVPIDDYGKLLNIPKQFDKGMGGGKPVTCYDLDGFRYAYGISENMAEIDDINISRKVNNIHELSHMIHSEFFTNKQVLGEGFAETVPLYILGYEEKFSDYKNMIKNLDTSKIESINELLKEEKDGSFGKEAVLPNRSCSFRYSYISSYLFVRGCIEQIEKTYAISKKDAVQFFLETVKQSNNNSEYLIYDIYNSIGLDEKTPSKKLQMDALKSIRKTLD